MMFCKHTRACTIADGTKYYIITINISSNKAFEKKLQQMHEFITIFSVDYTYKVLV